MTEQEEIAIIGFGLSGIAAARWAVHYGFRPVVYEKNGELGGVWLSHNYIGCSLQTNKYSYHFSDMLMPDDYPIYPTGFQVREYLAEYCKRYDLLRYVRFNADVSSVQKDGDKWKITVGEETHTYKYAIISTGFYGGKKQTIPYATLAPDIKDPESTFKDKSVVVIGNGPTGCDMACVAVENGAKDVVLLYRSPRWIFTRWAGSISLHFLTLRFFLKVAHFVPRVLLRIVLISFFMLSFLVNGQYLDLEYPEEKVNRNNLTLNENIYRYVYSRKVQMIKDPYETVQEAKLITRNGVEYPFDVLVDGTGYKTALPLLGNDDNVPKMYRNILPIGQRTLGVIGFAASFNWAQISEAQCHWFFRQLTGRFTVPTIEKQKEVVAQINMSDYHDYAYLAYDYIDMLRKDMYGNISVSFWDWFKFPKYNYE